MRLIFVIGCLLTTVSGFAQSLEVMELGNLMGEMGNFESTLRWKNTKTDTLAYRLWSGREELMVSEATQRVAPGQEAMIPYKLDISEAQGEQVYELRLLGSEDIVLHGFLLKTRVFEAEKEVFRAYRNTFFPFKSTHQVMNLKAGFIGDVLTDKFNLFNFGGEELDLEGAFTDDDRLEVSFEPAKVRHNAFTRLSLTLRSTDANESGFERKKVVIYQRDSTVLATIPVQYTLEPRPESNETLINTGPHMTLSKLTHDFRVMEVGDLEEVMITITNTGRSVLMIEKLEANCDCLEYELASEEIDQGQSTQLTVRFNAADRLGYERKTLALFTNDPDQPTRVLTFKAHVK